MVKDKIAGWLHEVELTPGSERQHAITSAADEYAASASAAAMPDLVLLAHRVPASNAFHQITEAVAAHDDTFACGIEELETQLVAAVFVATVMEESSFASTTAAGLVLNAAATGLSSAIASLPGLATETHDRQGGAVRERGPITFALETSGMFDAVPAFDQDGANVLHQEVRALREASVAALGATANALAELVTRLSNRLDAADEELDLLWWCFAGRSESLKQAWASVTSTGLAAIAAAVEMDQHLKFPAEPQSATSLLAKVLGDHASNNVTLAEAIEDAGMSNLVLGLTVGHQLLPVLSSLREYRELDGKPAWKGSVARWNIDPDRSWTALDLAGECLREQIILRLTTGSNG
jgi:hypothetical protein